MAGNIFLSEIYRAIFQARNLFFCTIPGKIFFLVLQPHHFSNGPSLTTEDTRLLHAMKGYSPSREKLFYHIP